MKKLFSIIFFYPFGISFAQTGWTVCTAPVFTNRVDDIFMVNTITGYAVSGDGKIVKTTDGGENWNLILENNALYCRSVEFINTQKGFVGAFSISPGGPNVLRRTHDGGITWTDLTALLDPRARKGICGIAAPDSNTIYAGGNWYQDSGYIIKSVDGGNSWNFMDMHVYASSIIDLHFINKDIGFAVGKGPLPDERAVILYTTNGGASWTRKYESSTSNAYVWKIQQLNSQIFFASQEDQANVPARVLRSNDGGMTWVTQQVINSPYYIEGIGYIDKDRGWTGGGSLTSFETRDGGQTWDSIAVCPLMNRVFRVNDTMLFATGNRIWKFKKNGSTFPVIPGNVYSWMKCYPNPVKGILTMEVYSTRPTHVLIILVDAAGRRVKTITNKSTPVGTYTYTADMKGLPPGIYFAVLKTHEDKQGIPVMVSR